MILPSPAASHAFGASLAPLVRVGDVITLAGPLGAGKTSFAIVQPYAPPETRLPILHVDLYRIDDPRELDELGLDEARLDSVLMVEWPERAGADAWPDALALSLVEQDGGRALTARVPAGWTRRWPT